MSTNTTATTTATATEPLLTAEPAEPAWSEASLHWLVTPQPSFPAAQRPGGVRVGLTDVAVIKSTSDLFAQLDDRFGGDHARQSVIQYLSRDVAPLLRGQYTEAVGRALFSTVAEARMVRRSCDWGMSKWWTTLP